MLREGDPEVWAYLPNQPDLSGEWAGDLTPNGLFEVITGADPLVAANVGDLVETLADAYERGVSDAFGPACERALAKFCEATQ
jgi:hypothetical protein